MLGAQAVRQARLFGVPDATAQEVMDLLEPERKPA
jgi:hypothetical protein